MINPANELPEIRPSSARRAGSSGLRYGFTLVELMVVIAIIGLLSLMAFVVAQRVMLGSQKVVCTNLMRNISVGLEAYDVDYNKPPLPAVKKDWDTILGDPGGLYSTSALVSVLTGGEDSEWAEGDGNFYDLASLNPGGTVYLDLNELTSVKEGGLGKDGKLYDPWGQELMIAFNSRIQGQDENGGYHDNILHTWGLAEWAEIKPAYQSHVIWSYGKDKEKGKGEKASFRGSDDVKSF